MITISLCMIVKNEEDTLEKCLNSTANVADEIIIVDTGSEDRTKEIAAMFTDKIYDFDWINDFSAARNFSYEQAGMDYILWLAVCYDKLGEYEKAALFNEMAAGYKPDSPEVLYNNKYFESRLVNH